MMTMKGNGRRTGGRSHPAGDRPWTDDAVEHGAAPPGGGFDPQFGSRGRVGARPGGARVPTGERSPRRVGALKLRGIEPGRREELVPIEWRGRWGRLLHLGWDSFKAEKFAIRVGFQTHHAGLLERRIVVVHRHMELALRRKGLRAFAIPEVYEGRLARRRILPPRVGFFGMRRRVSLVVLGVLQSPRTIGRFGRVAEVADVIARVACQRFRGVFQIEFRSDAKARAGDHGRGNQHQGGRQPRHGDLRLQPVRLSGGSHQIRRRRLARRQRRGQRIAARQSRRHRDRRRGTLPRIRLQAAHDHPLRRRIEIARDRSNRHRRGSLLHLHQFHQRRSFEGALPGEDLVKQQPQRVNIALHRDFGARQLLRRHVGRSAAAHVALQLLGQPREPEIHDDHLAAAIDHHIRRFQIAMQDALFVRRIQSRAELAGGLHRLVHRQPPDAPKQRTQILAVHELHRNVMQPLRHTDVVNAAYVRVRHLARDPHFVIKASQRAIVGGRGFRQKLQRHRLAQRQVDSAVDFAHPAASQQSRHTIPPGNHGTRQKAAFIHAAGGAQARHRSSAGPKRHSLSGSGI